MQRSELVLDFISNFNEVRDFFSVTKNTYEFAVILQKRFSWQFHTHLMFDPVTYRFGLQVEKEIYDITGDVTDTYNWTPWLAYAPTVELLEQIIYRKPESVRFCRFCREAILDDIGNAICPHSMTIKTFCVKEGE